MTRVLIVDTDGSRLGSVGQVLEFLEYEVAGAVAPSELGNWFDEGGGQDLVVLGPCESEDQVLEGYQTCRARDSYLPILLLTTGDERLARHKELRAGVVAHSPLPLRYQSFHHALRQINIYLENRALGGDSRSLELFRNLVGSSARTRKVRRMIEQVANTDATVLILGESGTGKEVVARNIHYHSTRRYKPFVPVNCGAIPSELLESELFGHEKGAFTGAISARRGRFEMAEGGTLFLDEIGDMPLPMQVKILRVLQERTFERVGSNRSVSVDVRVIAATHADLEGAIASGRFRQDLYYRLNVFPIETPALRERVEDLPLLINDLIARIEHEKRGSVRLSPGAVQALTQYPWPGNVRELANLIERLAILFPYGVVDAHDLPEKYRTGELAHLSPEERREVLEANVPSQRLPREGLDLKEHLNQMEYLLIQQALEEADGIVAHAAKRLKMGRTTLVEKMRKYGIKRQDQVTEA